MRARVRAQFGTDRTEKVCCVCVCVFVDSCQCVWITTTIAKLCGRRKACQRRNILHSLFLSVNPILCRLVPVPASVCFSITVSFFNFARNATVYVHVRELPTCCPVIPVSSDLHSLQLLASLVVKLCRRVRGEFVGVCLSACSPVNNTALKISTWS